ncbi:MAG: LLM class flavin-dependent oxidoreductase [Chloroflexota bacterium]|nr:MAG: LLM class flavin-dependent oxidoreductase [Chloroflexota bacterium]
MAVDYAVTYHVEGPRERPSIEIYREIARQVELADRLGYRHAWFGEHHGHAHIGHVPHPLLYALHLTGRTRQIGLGASVVCVSLHHPVLVAEQIAMLDTLSNGRASVGLGSGSTAAEFASYGLDPMEPEERRARFVEALDIVEHVWSGAPFAWSGPHYTLNAPGMLPVPAADLRARTWIGANSTDTARLAGRRGYGLQLSNMRALPELREVVAAYRAGRAESNAPGSERIAASAPLYVAETDRQALDEFAPAIDILYRENRRARAEESSVPETDRDRAEAIRFVVGSPERVADAMIALRRELPFTTLNVRPRWAGTTVDQVERSLLLFAERVRPILEHAWSVHTA